MPFQSSRLKTALKRGALVTAANGQVVLAQLFAESLFKLLLGIPISGGVVLVLLLIGPGVADLAEGGLRGLFLGVVAALTVQPAALLAFLLALLVVVVGGSCLTFLVKAGTVAVLVEGYRRAGPIDQVPVTLASMRTASAYSLDRFSSGCGRFFRRYLVLGLTLLLIHGASAGAYLGAVMGGVRAMATEEATVLGWTLTAALASTMLVAWITIVNLVYLLIQIAIAADDLGVRDAVGRTARFLGAEARQVAGVFAVVFVVLVLSLAASVLATAALGMIAFVPFLWLAAVPIQLVAWLLRGLLFQYVGLAALVAYLDLYEFRDRRRQPHASQPSSLSRTMSHAT